MAQKAQVTQDGRRSDSGYAIITITEIPPVLETLSFSLKVYTEYLTPYVTPMGRQDQRVWLHPEEAWFAGDDVKLVVGPDVTKWLEPLPYVLSLQGEGLVKPVEIVLVWPPTLQKEHPTPSDADQIGGTKQHPTRTPRRRPGQESSFSSDSGRDFLSEFGGPPTKIRLDGDDGLQESVFIDATPGDGISPIPRRRPRPRPTAEQLAAVGVVAPPEAPPPSPQPAQRSSGGMAFAVIGILALGAAGGVGWFLTQGKVAPTPPQAPVTVDRVAPRARVEAPVEAAPARAPALAATSARLAEATPAPRAALSPKPTATPEPPVVRETPKPPPGMTPIPILPEKALEQAFFAWEREDMPTAERFCGFASNGDTTGSTAVTCGTLFDPAKQLGALPGVIPTEIMPKNKNPLAAMRFYLTARQQGQDVRTNLEELRTWLRDRALEPDVVENIERELNSIKLMANRP